MHDALGSVRLHLDDTGAALAPTSYSPFGTPTVGSPEPFGFAGELHVGGLQYLRARWYDPAAGVFVGRDPFAGCPRTPYSLHPYQYSYSNPILNTDPSGKCVVSLYYWPIGDTGNIYYHIDVIVNDCDAFGHDQSRRCDLRPEETLWVYNGGPEFKNLGSPREDWHKYFADLCDLDSLFGTEDENYGRVRANKRPWSGTEDDSNLPKDTQQLVRAMNELPVALGQGNILTVLFNSEPCTEVMAAMDEFMNTVESSDVNYNFGRRNSNGVAYGFLEAAGISHPRGFQHPKRVQGYTRFVYEAATGKKSRELEEIEDGMMIAP
jgi:RHS repeat-associated protein